MPAQLRNQTRLCIKANTIIDVYFANYGVSFFIKKNLF